MNFRAFGYTAVTEQFSKSFCFLARDISWKIRNIAQRIIDLNNRWKFDVAENKSSKLKSQVHARWNNSIDRSIEHWDFLNMIRVDTHWRWAIENRLLTQQGSGLLSIDKTKTKMILHSWEERWQLNIFLGEFFFSANQHQHVRLFLEFDRMLIQSYLTFSIEWINKNVSLKSLFLSNFLWKFSSININMFSLIFSHPLFPILVNIVGKCHWATTNPEKAIFLLKKFDQELKIFIHQVSILTRRKNKIIPHCLFDFLCFSSKT